VAEENALRRAGALHWTIGACAVGLVGILAVAGAAQLRAAPLQPAGPAAPSPSLLTPVAIFGSDDRREVPEELSALEGRIGMLYEQSTQTLCTAFCVAKDVIATAAHCLFQPKNARLPDLEEVTFRLNYGKTYQTSGIHGRRTPYTKNYIAVGTTSFNNEPPLSAPRDWALAKLERPICRFGHIKVQAAPVNELIRKSQQNKVFQVAYHWHYKHWQLAYASPCRIQRDYEQIKWRFIRQHFVDYDQLLLHDCDTGGASSGSPLLLNLDPPNAPVAIAINVGTYTRTRILIRKGQVVKKLEPDIIANTGVNGSAFNQVIAEMEVADIINSRDDMVRMQSELQSRGLYKGSLDGELGRNTRAAIIQFETLLNLPVTGLPTQALLRRFDEERVRPNHMYSNVQGVPPPTQTAPPPPPVQSAPIALPERRKPAKTTKPFNPFGRF
jgi:protease YdgD